MIARAPPASDFALIGGVVGGTIGAIILILLIVAMAICSKKSSSGDAEMVSVRLPPCPTVSPAAEYANVPADLIYDVGNVETPEMESARGETTFSSAALLT